MKISRVRADLSVNDCMIILMPYRYGMRYRDLEDGSAIFSRMDFTSFCSVLVSARTDRLLRDLTWESQVRALQRVNKQETQIGAARYAN